VKPSFWDKLQALLRRTPPAPPEPVETLDSDADTTPLPPSPSVMPSTDQEMPPVEESSNTTRPLEDGEIEELLEDVGMPIHPKQVAVGLGYSTGLQREHNEDAIYATVSNLSANNRDLLFGLFVVADGMGGHQHGEVASEIATRALAHYLMNAIHTTMFKPDAELPQESLMDLMREAVQRAHRAVLKHAPGGGTTLTAVLLLNGQMTIAHVGDSRAYAIYPDGRMDVLTRDHSLVKRLEELGQLTHEEAAVHPQRNVLYRALGQAEPFDPDIFTIPAPKNGYLLLCSDGLWGVVPEELLFETIITEPSPTRACHALVKAANAAGGPDNISAVLVRFAES